MQEDKGMIHLGRLRIANPYVLAPMSMYSDIGLRKICSSYGCSYYWTEQIFTDEFVSKSELLARKLDSFDKVGIQFISNNADELKRAIEMVNDKEYYPRLENITSIDLNLGCPTQQIMARNLGSRLLNQPKLARELFSTLRKHSNLPVSAKFRLAINSKHKKTNPYLRIAQIAKEEELDFITIHARTAGQLYEGEIDLNAIKEVSENVDILLIGNGGVHDKESAEKMLEYCDAVMIGQHALSEPFIFKQLNEPDWKFDAVEEKKKCIKEYFSYAEKYNIGFQHIKIHVQALMRGIKGREKTLSKLTHTKNVEEIKALLGNLLN